MGSTINIGSRTSTYDIANSDSTINLAKNDIINVENGNGIVQNTSFNSDTINVNGEIHVSGGSALRIEGLANKITTGFDSVITGNIGIWLDNGTANSNLDGNIVVNQAQVVAIEAIRNEDADTSILNFNLLRGDKAIVGVTYGLTLTNGKFATIDGDGRGIDLSGVSDTSEQSKITNDGTINGDIAIVGGAERENVTNHGTINGNVQLGAGSDLFDGSGGVVNGVIQGGDDNDTYIVDSTDINLQEQATGGTGDTVESTVSYTLHANFENLFLLGTAKINGIGNAEANNIHGNNAANTLRGRGGEDLLFGGKGDDILFGGTESDHFVFQKGFGHDTIKDFAAGGSQHDVIDLSDVPSIASFSDMKKHHVEEHKHDLVIDDGRGDTITLHNVDKGDLHASDFLFVPS